MSESFAELFEESLKEIDMTPGSIVQGVVVDIDSDWVTVNAGLKSEGVIPLSQFVAENGEVDLNIGDTVDVALDAVKRVCHVKKRSVLKPGKNSRKLSKLKRLLKV